MDKYFRNEHYKRCNAMVSRSNLFHLVLFRKIEYKKNIENDQN